MGSEEEVNTTMDGLTEEEIRGRNRYLLENNNWLDSGEEEPNDEEKELVCLGIPERCVQSPTFVNFVAQSPEYNKLPRPVVPPGPCPATVEDVGQSNYDLIEKVWNGKFSNFDYKIADEGFLWITAEVAGQEGGKTETVNLELDWSEGRPLQLVRQSLDLSLEFSEDDQDTVGGVLVTRVLHFFLREAGWILPWQILLELCEALHHREYSPEARLDLAILRTDLFANLLNGSKQDMGVCLCSAVGPALLDVGLVEQATRLYHEVMELYLDDPGLKAEASLYAGGAFLHARLLQDAMEVTLAGLQFAQEGETATSWNGMYATDGVPKHLLMNLVRIQHELAHQSVEEGERETDGLYWMTHPETIWMGLASLAGLAKVEPQDHAVGLLLADQKGFWGYLKPKYHNVKQARKALNRILASGSIASFEVEIQSVLKKAIFQVQINHHPSTSDESVEVEWKKNGEKLKVCAHCHSEGTEGEKLLWCTCGRVPYCSKECQKSHWKHHKTEHKLHFALIEAKSKMKE